MRIRSHGRTKARKIIGKVRDLVIPSLDADREEPIDCKRKDDVLKRRSQSDEAWNVVSESRESKRVTMVSFQNPRNLLLG